jgi:acetyl esterase
LSAGPPADPPLDVVRDLAYGPFPEQRLDLYRPARQPAAGGIARPLPAVLSIHGGGWQGGDRADPRMAARVALPLARRGYAVAAVGYRRAPRHRFPAQLEDVTLAAAWLRGEAAELGIDPARLGAVGGSAGGHLAALLGTGELSPAPAPATLRCVVNLLGPTDLTPAGYLERVADPALRADLAKILGELIGTAWEADPAAWRRASPLFRVSAASAPFFLLHGRDDAVVPPEQARRFAAALAAAGVEVETALVDGLGHDVDADPKISQRVDAALARAWRFLDRHLLESAPRSEQAARGA